jgi:hypothetical protein
MGSAPGFWDGLRWSAASFSSFFFACGSELIEL